MQIETKRHRLLEILNEYTLNDVCVAFSGGIDSSLLLHLAAECAIKNKSNVYAVTFDTALHPRCDVEAARTVASEIGTIHKVICVDELENAELVRNPRNRCYLCKKTLFKKLIQYASQHNAGIVIEGTNGDDLHQYRPGLRAVEELGVKSPLAEAKLTKSEIRQWAGELEISVADRPSTPCLATRLPYDTKIEVEILRKIEQGEERIRSYGFHNIRLRVHQDIIRLEVDSKEFEKMLLFRGEIISFLKELGFHYVTLDLEGFRSGSMDIA